MYIYTYISLLFLWSRSQTSTAIVGHSSLFPTYCTCSGYNIINIALFFLYLHQWFLPPLDYMDLLHQIVLECIRHVLANDYFRVTIFTFSHKNV